jgi:hypothetical protein
MSKRHHSSRRRSYGRRQHELRERTERQDPASAAEPRSEPPDGEYDGFTFLDLEFIGRRLGFAVGE